MDCEHTEVDRRTLEPCWICNGTGHHDGGCTRCNGTGKVPWLTITTINRARCKTCHKQCDGHNYEAHEGAYVMRHLREMERSEEAELKRLREPPKHKPKSEMEQKEVA